MMKIIKSITKNEVIAVFLKAELSSSRFANRYPRLTKKQLAMIDEPNLRSKTENSYRMRLLGRTRGYPDKRIFTNFPKDVMWKRAYLSKRELKTVHYIDFPYWNKLSGGSRLAKDAVKRISKPKKKSRNIYWSISKKIIAKERIPEMIIVSQSKRSKMVVLEGHARLTALMLSMKHVPDRLEVIIGFSTNIKGWRLYGNRMPTSRQRAGR
jgi:hypothetical protein